MSVVPAFHAVLLRDVDGGDAYISGIEEMRGTARFLTVLSSTCTQMDELDAAVAHLESVRAIVITSQKAACALRESCVRVVNSGGHVDTTTPCYVVGFRCVEVLRETWSNIRGVGTKHAADLCAQICSDLALTFPASIGHCLLLTGDKTLDVIPDGLAGKAPCSTIQVYATNLAPPDAIRSVLETAVSENSLVPLLVLCFFSPSGVDAVMQGDVLKATLALAHSDLHPALNIQCVAFGPTTQARLQSLGLPCAAVCDTPTPAGLCEAISGLLARQTEMPARA